MINTICPSAKVSSGADMFQRVNELRGINEGLLSELKTYQTVAAELRCRVVDAERKLLEKEHYKEVASVSAADVETLYADWGISMDENQKLARECYWLLPQGFGLFLSAFSQSEEFKGSLERVYRAYRDVGYQSSLKDGYSYSSQGMKRKETPLYNSKAKKQLAKLDKEFSENTPALLSKITDNLLMSLDELKSLLTPDGPSSPKSLTREDSPWLPFKTMIFDMVVLNTKHVAPWTLYLLVGGLYVGASFFMLSYV
ncbi:hypothetical protein HanXRQr2_Chr06g0247501 [Helianthus annuus]|uniref:Uncharacterized protein n=1 Tax=Helianthus annuus TaxID=4232 RepID=A0A9K3NJ28_HELAN|nr:hypothetical protein HanXRQr2_Chr06g0247501 [Helianthus annuus]KAJ0572674.1 hypothetical protein HanHA89_Chr06g0218311 [Helianthus annuus]